MLFNIHYSFLIEVALGIEEENLFTLFCEKSLERKARPPFRRERPKASFKT